MRLHTSYMISTLPRSGSWLLAESLHYTGIAGRPREYFHEKNAAKWLADRGTSSHADYLAEILKSGTTRNGVFGVKAHWYQLSQVAAKLGQVPDYAGLDMPESISRFLPGLRYIWLTRRDKVRQAVSFYRAAQTGQWWKLVDDAEPSEQQSSTAALQPLQFDFTAIESFEKLSLTQDAMWREYFGQAGVEPLVVVYEELVQSFTSEIRRILDFLEVRIPKKLPIRTRLQQQTDSLTNQWVQQYVQMKHASADILN